MIRTEGERPAVSVGRLLQSPQPHQQVGQVRMKFGAPGRQTDALSQKTLRLRQIARLLAYESEQMDRFGVRGARRRQPAAHRVCGGDFLSAEQLERPRQFSVSQVHAASLRLRGRSPNEQDRTVRERAQAGCVAPVC